VVLGIERPLGTQFRIEGQFVFHYTPNWASPLTASGGGIVPDAVAQGIAATNALILGLQQRSEAGATFHIVYNNENNGIQLELFVLGYATTQDYLVRPQFTYSWSPPLKTFLGVTYAGGPSDAPLGAYSIYNAAYVGGSYQF
jgi:hypothetical protein